MNISAFTVRRPVLVSMMTMVIVLIGVISFFRIPINLMPDTTIPTLSIITYYTGAGPVEVEKIITRQVEDSLSAVEGIKYLTSSSRDSRSIVRIVFEWGTDLDEATREVQQRLDKVTRRLPEEVNRPTVRKYDANDLPVVVFGVVSEDDPIELTRKLEDDITPMLVRVEGVGEVDILGGMYSEVQIAMDLKKLKVLKLSVNDVASEVKKQNFTMPVGRVMTGTRRLNLRISADFSNIWQLKHTVVKTNGSRKIFLKDIADVEIKPQKRWAYSYVNGERGLRLAIQKKSGANTVQVARELKKVIDIYQRRNQDMKFVEVLNTAEYIEKSIKNVQLSVLYGGILAVLVLVIFLRNIRSTLVIGISIPISVIATFALIHFGGLSLNLMTIGGLGLGIGMLVDNAIVVLENIMRLRHSGYTLMDAAIKGSHEVQSSIVASTITTLIVFLPVIFMEGITSLLFKELAIVVGFSMVISLASAILLVPTLSSLIIRKSDDPETHVERGVWRLFAVMFEKIENVYCRILRDSLNSRAWTIIICTLLLASSLVLIPKIGSEFMPKADSNEIRLRVSMVRGTSMDTMKEQMLFILSIINQEFPEVEKSISYVREGDNAHTAFINLSLVSPGQRDITCSDLRWKIHERFTGVPGLSVRGWVPRSPFEPRLPNTSGNSIELEIRGFEFTKAQEIAESLKDQMEEIEGVEEVNIPNTRTREEKLVKIDKTKASDLGIPLQKVASEIKSVLSGSSGGKFVKDGDELPIKLSILGHEKVRPEDIKSLTINNSGQEPILLSNIVNVEDYEGPATIERDNRQRIMRLGVSTKDREESFIIEDIESLMDNFYVPAGFSVMIGGNYLQQKQSSRDLIFSLILAVLLIYMVMAAQFESLMHPFVVMFSVPLAAIGVLWTLFLTDTTFNMQSNMGCVMLAGIVVNNAILLVDQTNALRVEGMTMTEALIEAGRRRLRPILMTATTTVLGLLPLALGIGEGGEAQAPMARAVMGGLISSTFITLVLVPIIYSLFERGKIEKC